MGLSGMCSDGDLVHSSTSLEYSGSRMMTFPVASLALGVGPRNDFALPRMPGPTRLAPRPSMVIHVRTSVTAPSLSSRHSVASNHARTEVTARFSAGSRVWRLSNLDSRRFKDRTLIIYLGPLGKVKPRSGPCHPWVQPMGQVSMRQERS